MSNEVIQETTPLVECSAFHRGMSVLEASLRNTEDSESIISGLLKGAAEFYGASRASVVEADWDLGIGVITYEWCKDGVPAQRDKVIELPSPRFQQFSRALLADYDFIAENKNAIRHDEDARHCLLVLDAEGMDGFLVDPQGHNYARYSAFVPNARSLLTPDMAIDRSYLSPAEPWRDESRDEMLRMTLRVNGKPDYTLVLPADEEYLDAVKNYLDIDVFADAMLCDIHFKVPYIGELIRDTDCPAVEDYNDFAEALEDIWQKDGMLLTYAAILDAERPDTLRGACELLRNLDNYQRITEGAYGYGQQRLQETLGLDDEAIYELEGYMDFERYGSDCMEHDGVVETEFGRLRRLDPPFPEGQTQGQQMLQ